jgi:ascorbate-specific PTS system EIIC-type component UlaA
MVLAKVLELIKVEVVVKLQEKQEGDNNMIATELRDLSIFYFIMYLIFGIISATIITILMIIILSIGYSKYKKEQKKDLDSNMKKTVELMEKLFPEEKQRRNKK